MQDAELIRLGQELRQAWNDEQALSDADDAVLEKAVARTVDIADRIKFLPATTMEGLAVKAFAVSAVFAGHVDFGPEVSSQLANSIIGDLLALAP
ncbi:hypothetical protein [Chelativorans sp. AA-79]|uniref:hypothetical protein n=1 Tax=Chelativorans sp. AA-79 TaxID=3028735 RepID=UPI0023F8721A|nr:hypothetical protein [Chelativorans sp. AA-79]WEX10330.1 hypothetical protein PVE73_05050 [Chelativorans sp. AA-79]